MRPPGALVTAVKRRCDRLAARLRRSLPGHRRTALVGLAGVGVGVLLMTVLQRPQPVAFVQGGDARVRDRTGATRTAGGLLPGDRVQAGTTTVELQIAGQGLVSMEPGAKLTVDAALAVRLDEGGIEVDATAVVQELRVQTPAGDVVLTGARVDLRAIGGAPPSPGGLLPAAMAVVRVDAGQVRLENAHRAVTLTADERGLLVAGQPPRRTQTADVTPVLLASAVGSAFAQEQEDPGPQAAAQPLPITAAAPGQVLVVPVAVPVGATPEPVRAPPLSGGAWSAGPTAPAAGGGVRGRVELEGTPPREARDCEDGLAGWRVTDGHLADVYVHVSSPLPPARAASKSFTITQRGCTFAPALVPMQLGQRLELRASDGSAHGVRVTAGSDVLLDVPLPSGGIPVVFQPVKQGHLRLTCDAHPDAVAHVAVSAHPWFAVTGTDGAFVLTAVPPGRHTLRAWHPRAGERTAEVTVIAGRTAEITFRFEGVGPVVSISPTPPPPEPAPDPDPPAPTLPPEPHECRHALAGSSPVARACAQGGLARARAVMRQIVRHARQRGVAVDCSSCHTDDRTFVLRPMAREHLGLLINPVVPLVQTPSSSRGPGGAAWPPRAARPWPAR